MSNSDKSSRQYGDAFEFWWAAAGLAHACKPEAWEAWKASARRPDEPAARPSLAAPVAWAISWNGMLCNIWLDEPKARHTLDNLNHSHPDGVRRLVPLYEAPQSPLAAPITEAMWDAGEDALDEGLTWFSIREAMLAASPSRQREDDPALVSHTEAPLTTLLAWAVGERSSWEGNNADRHWQMNRVVGQIEDAIASAPPSATVAPDASDAESLARDGERWDGPPGIGVRYWSHEKREWVTEAPTDDTAETP